LTFGIVRRAGAETPQNLGLAGLHQPTADEEGTVGDDFIALVANLGGDLGVVLATARAEFLKLDGDHHQVIQAGLRRAILVLAGAAGSYCAARHPLSQSRWPRHWDAIRKTRIRLFV
jgi:hypothetical protein